MINGEDIERAAIRVEPPADILAGVAAVRDLRRCLTRAVAVDLVPLDGARQRLNTAAAADRRALDLKALADIEAALAAEGDKAKAAGLLGQARSIAVGLDDRDPLDAGRFSMFDVVADTAPKAWTCRAFQWIPGRPAMGIGYPGAGKTFSLLAALVALSVGRMVWGCSNITGPIDPLTGFSRPLRCLVVDLDAGKDDVRSKLGRLVRGMGISAVEIERARLEIAAHHGLAPRDVIAPIEGIALSDLADPGGLILASYNPGDLAAFREAWVALTRGFDLVLIDPMRDLAPFADENDSRIGAIPRVLGAASRASNAAIVLVHHAGRVAPSKPNQPARVPQHASRGSSAIDGKAGAQLVFERDLQGRRKVTMTRDADPDDSEGALAPLYLSLRRAVGEAEVLAERVDDDGGDPQAQISAAASPAKAGGRSAADVDFAREVLQANPGINGMDALMNAVCDGAKRRGKRKGGPMGGGRTAAALRVLEAAGEIEDRGTKKPRRPRWFWRDPSSAEPPPPIEPTAEQLRSRILEHFDAELAAGRVVPSRAAVAQGLKDAGYDAKPGAVRDALDVLIAAGDLVQNGGALALG